MNDQRMQKKILRVQVYKSRKRGRHRIRWLDNVFEDLTRIDVRCYTEMAMDKTLEKICVWKPGLTLGYSAKEEDKYFIVLCVLIN